MAIAFEKRYVVSGGSLGEGPYWVPDLFEVPGHDGQFYRVSASDAELSKFVFGSRDAKKDMGFESRPMHYNDFIQTTLQKARNKAVDLALLAYLKIMVLN